MRRFGDRGSRGSEIEDVLAQEIRPKKYKEGEGGEKNVIEKEIIHEHYKEGLIERKKYTAKNESLAE